MREQPSAIAEFHARDAEAGADVLCALTSETMGAALLPIGMAFRAAALTRRAVELAQEAARTSSKPTLIAGWIGNPRVRLSSNERVAEECSLHAARLLSDGCDLIIARSFGAPENAGPGFSRFSRLTALISGAATRLSTWVFAEINQPNATTDGESLQDLLAASSDAGAQALLLSVPHADTALAALAHLKPAESIRVGFLIAASNSPDLTAWEAGARSLARAGVRILGGGAGTSFEHVRALARAIAGELECE